MFNDKSLKSVADAVMKIMEAEKMAKKDHDQDGKIESGKDEYLGSRIRAAKMAGKLKEEEQLEELSKATVKSYVMKKMEKPTTTNKDVKGMTNAYNRLKNYKPTSEEVEQVEEGWNDRMDDPNTTPEQMRDRADMARERSKNQPTGQKPKPKNSTYTLGFQGKSKTMTVKKEEVELDEAFPTVADGEKNLRAKEGKTSKGTLTKTKTGVKHERDYDDQPEPEEKRGRGRPKKRLGEMRQEYMQYISEEPDNETFTKELEDQKAKFAGKKKGGDVAKPSVQAVKQEEVEQIDEISKETASKYLTAPQGKGANKYKVSHDKASYPDYETMTKHATNVRRALQRSGGQAIYKKPDYYKEEIEQIDEVAPPGREDQVKALKKVPGIDNPYAVSWASYRKSHPKKSKE
jgi:hypothetical protein